MAFDREAAKAAGYSESEINDYIRDNPAASSNEPPAPGAEPPAPTPVYSQPAQRGILPNFVPDALNPSAETATTAGLGAVAGAGALAVPYYGYQGLKKGVELLRGAPTAAPPAAPVAPVAPTASPILGANGQPMVRSVPTPANNPSIIEQGINYAKQMQKIAAEKVMQGARAAGPYAARAGVGVTAALMPGNAGQNYGASFPQSGPYKGMEINPNTGRPWTPQELAQINGR
jgi:hypothetical protein